MKLLFINSIGRSKWGGGEKWMLLAANGLRSRGHDVTIACLPNSIIQSKAQEAGIPIFPICIYSDFSVLGYYSIKRFVASNKTELIIGCQNKDVRISGLVARELGFPSVV